VFLLKDLQHCIALFLSMAGILSVELYIFNVFCLRILIYLLII